MKFLIFLMALFTSLLALVHPVLSDVIGQHDWAVAFYDTTDCTGATGQHIAQYQGLGGVDMRTCPRVGDPGQNMQPGGGDNSGWGCAWMIRVGKQYYIQNACTGPMDPVGAVWFPKGSVCSVWWGSVNEAPYNGESDGHNNFRMKAETCYAIKDHPGYSNTGAADSKNALRFRCSTCGVTRDEC